MTCARWARDLAAVCPACTSTNQDCRLHRLVIQSLSLFDLRHRDLAFDTIGVEFDLVADFHLLEHGRILDAEDHGHPLVHVELFDRTVLERDFARGFVDLRHLTVDHGSLGHGHRRERERKDEDAYRSESYLAHGSSPAFFARAPYFTLILPTMPFSYCPR